MNEKVQKIMEKVDAFTDKVQIFPKFIDKGVQILKHPFMACIPGVINKIASRFSGIIFTLFAILFFICCLKNSIICLFFEDAPAGMMFGYAIASLISIVLNYYMIYKTSNIFEKIISTSTCRISSTNIFGIFTFLNLFGSICSLIGGIYFGIEAKSVQLIIGGIVGFFLLLLMALYTSTPEDFAIVEDSTASAGEDFTAIATFFIKVILRLIPILIFVLPIIGIFNCFSAIFETYVESYGNQNFLSTDFMIAEVANISNYLLIGLIPLAAYFYYLINYVILDLIRAVLSLPSKLDELKK